MRDDSTASLLYSDSRDSILVLMLMFFASEAPPVTKSMSWGMFQDGVLVGKEGIHVL